MGIIKEKMIQDLVIRGMSKRTQENYLGCIKQFVKYYMKSPDLLSLEDINSYQLYLIRDRQISVSYFNIQVAALKFLYGVTLKREWNIELIPYHKESKRLPVVLSKEEVVQLYKAVSYIKHKAMILTLYSTGIRASELTHLKVSDIDSKRMQIRIDQGKGGKDRYVRLSEKLLKILRLYWCSEKIKPKTWLFPGYGEDSPLSRHSVTKMILKARKKAGIQKQVTTHTVRHTCATHMLESGENIKKIALMLGHSSLKTTGKYLHVASNYLDNMKTPLDDLELD